MSTALTLRPIAREELLAFRACLQTAFHHPRELAPLNADRGAHVVELDRTIAAFDGEEVVATTAVYSLNVSIPGGALPCAGVTWVSVLPTHRRRGLLRQMMDHVLAQAVQRGEPLAALWSSEGTIYGRFGFAPAARSARVAVALGGAGSRPLPGGDEGLTVRFHPLDGARPLLAPLYEASAALRAGLTSRTDDWWERFVLADPPALRGGASDKLLVLARRADGAPAGYAIYRSRGGYPAETTVELLELSAPQPDAAAALWAHLTSLDLAVRLEAPNRPLDDPLPLLFDDVRRVETRGIRETLWLSLLDVPRALEARTWVGPCSLVLRVRDERLPANDGTWELTVADDGSARCAPTDRAPELALEARELARVYLGGTPLAQLAAAGRVRELSAGAAARLDRALHVARAPWTQDVF